MTEVCLLVTHWPEAGAVAYGLSAQTDGHAPEGAWHGALPQLEPPALGSLLALLAPLLSITQLPIHFLSLTSLPLAQEF